MANLARECTGRLVSVVLLIIVLHARVIVHLQLIEVQEAQLSPRDRAMRRVS